MFMPFCCYYHGLCHVMMFTLQAKRYNAAPMSFICRWCELGLSVMKLIPPLVNFIVKKKQITYHYWSPKISRIFINKLFIKFKSCCFLLLLSFFPGIFLEETVADFWKYRSSTLFEFPSEQNRDLDISCDYF